MRESEEEQHDIEYLIVDSQGRKSLPVGDDGGIEYNMRYEIGDKEYIERILVAPKIKHNSPVLPVSEFCVCLPSLAMCATTICATNSCNIVSTGIAVAATSVAFCILVPCVEHQCDKCYPTELHTSFKIVINQIELLQHSPRNSEVTIEIKRADVDSRKSLVRVLSEYEMLNNIKVFDIIKHSKLIIQLPIIATNDIECIQFHNYPYTQCQVERLFEKYNGGSRLVLRIPFSLKKNENSGYIDHIGVRHLIIRCTTQPVSKKYEEILIDEIHVKSNIIVNKGSVGLKISCLSNTIDRKKKAGKVVKKNEKLSIELNANGSVELQDRNSKDYQQEINTASFFIGGFLLRYVVGYKKWKVDIESSNLESTDFIPNQPSTSKANQFQSPTLSTQQFSLSSNAKVITEPSTFEADKPIYNLKQPDIIPLKQSLSDDLVWLPRQ